ncbi:DNA-directed RNA polymerase II subunit RPB1 [Rhizophlyctis rosea]|nr:DNA-directed RNA polymerase II subunit RPB1 [Rhizophlyctis rosea]
MADAGSKGSILNISQIGRCLVQKVVYGSRIPKWFKDRTLPHFCEFDDSPDARGFVRNSFIRGLTPQGLFLHAMGGREGLMDTALKTANSGYVQRRFIKGMEDIWKMYDGTVWNALGSVIQFRYGEDGMDGTAMENQVFPTLTLSDRELQRKYFSFEEEHEAIRRDRDFLRQQLGLEEGQFSLLLNIRHYSETARRSGSIGVTGAGDLEEGPHSYAGHGLHAGLDLQEGPHSDSGQDNQEPLTHEQVFRLVQILPKELTPDGWDERDNPSSRFLGILLGSELASRMVIDKYGFTRTQFMNLFAKTKDAYFKGLVSAGEGVGVIAGQSVGEPATQMRLNTFHSSGAGNKAMTTGIPRLQELINVANFTKTPGMVIYLRDDVKNDIKEAVRTKTDLVHITLSDLLHKFEILCDPDYLHTNLAGDAE